VLVPGVVPSQGQDSALLLVDPHEVPVSPFLQPVRVPLDSSTTLRRTSLSSQLSLICRIAEGVLCPGIQVTGGSWPSPVGPWEGGQQSGRSQSLCAAPVLQAQLWPDGP